MTVSTGRINTDTRYIYVGLISRCTFFLLFFFFFLFCFFSRLRFLLRVKYSRKGEDDVVLSPSTLRSLPASAGDRHVYYKIWVVNTMHKSLTQHSYALTCSDNVDTLLGSVVLVNMEMACQWTIILFPIKNKCIIDFFSWWTVTCIFNKYIRGVFDYCTNGNREFLRICILALRAILPGNTIGIIHLWKNTRMCESYMRYTQGIREWYTRHT